MAYRKRAKAIKAHEKQADRREKQWEAASRADFKRDRIASTAASHGRRVSTVHVTYLAQPWAECVSRKAHLCAKCHGKIPTGEKCHRPTKTSAALGVDADDRLCPGCVRSILTSSQGASS